MARQGTFLICRSSSEGHCFKSNPEKHTEHVCKLTRDDLFVNSLDSVLFVARTNNENKNKSDGKQQAMSTAVF